MMGHRALGRRHCIEPLTGSRCGIGVAEHLDVASQRQRADLPAGTVAVEPAHQFGAEAKREGLDLYAADARRDVMAKLVHKDEDRQDDQERRDIAEPTFNKPHLRYSLSRGLIGGPSDRRVGNECIRRIARAPVVDVDIRNRFGNLIRQ